MREVRWGIIGCGAVTEVKSGPALQKAEGSRLVAVMRRNAGLAETCPAPRRALVRRCRRPHRRSEVNAVYVATPPASHRDYTLQAAAAGKPVYVEKPMARTHAECLEMIAACREAGVGLYVAYYRRAQPRFLKVRDLLAAGAIGAPRTVTVTLHQRPGRCLPSEDLLAGAPGDLGRWAVPRCRLPHPGPPGLSPGARRLGAGRGGQSRRPVRAGGHGGRRLATRLRCPRHGLLVLCRRPLRRSRGDRRQRRPHRVRLLCRRPRRPGTADGVEELAIPSRSTFSSR